MTDNEMLQAMKQMLEPIQDEIAGIKTEFKKLNERVSIIEIKQDMTHRKIDDIELNLKVSERAIRKDIALLKDGQETLITVLETKGILPKVESN